MALTAKCIEGRHTLCRAAWCTCTCGKHVKAAHNFLVQARSADRIRYVNVPANLVNVLDAVACDIEIDKKYSGTIDFARLAGLIEPVCKLRLTQRGKDYHAQIHPNSPTNVSPPEIERLRANGASIRAAQMWRVEDFVTHVCYRATRTLLFDPDKERARKILDAALAIKGNATPVTLNGKHAGWIVIHMPYQSLMVLFCMDGFKEDALYNHVFLSPPEFP